MCIGEIFRHLRRAKTSRPQFGERRSLAVEEGKKLSAGAITNYPLSALARHFAYAADAPLLSLKRHFPRERGNLPQKGKAKVVLRNENK